jgi:hypothetical protein
MGRAPGPRDRARAIAELLPTREIAHARSPSFFLRAPRDRARAIAELLPTRHARSPSFFLRAVADAGEARKLVRAAIAVLRREYLETGPEADG